ncbi:o-succinylbenzoate--CoA ligase [Shewanella sp.]|uniref:o-succinylbenzoate--CoA ligase n=1 Tax=Shewanella sp. TaxID=50422 RepID=UPI00405409ED
MMHSPLQQMALANPHSTAITSPMGKISYAALYQQARLIAQSLKEQGLKPGGRLGCIAHNSATLICLYWACVEAKVIFFPISPRFPNGQINELLNDFAVDFYWTERPEFNSPRSQPIDLPSLNLLTLNSDNLPVRSTEALTTQTLLNTTLIEPMQPVSLILTSGSSGKAKAVMHSFSNHILSAKGSAKLIPLAPTDSWLLSLPLFHIGGLAILHRCALAGASVVLVKPELSMAQQIQQDSISHLSLVSAQLHDLLVQTEAELSSIKALLLGGGQIDKRLINTLKQLKINSFISYGMTEMSSQITTACLTQVDTAPLGVPLVGNELKLVAGTLWVRGSSLCLGYLQPTTLALSLPVDNQGWFCTDDKATFDEQGQLTLLGRAGNMFICGGENLHPEEVEAALKRHPEIDEALVFAQADTKFGQLPVAIIRCHGQLATAWVEDALSAQASLSIKRFLEQHIASFKCPRQYYPWPNVATNGLKLPRRQLVKAAIQSHEHKKQP